MQINGTSTGPTMAASEPPEPPPRNPERINASLHKLSESKTVKSLDVTSNSTTAAALGSDKSVNNNKPLKPILSLDNSVALNATSLANNKVSGNGTAAAAITSAAGNVNNVTAAASTATAVAQQLHNLHSPSNPLALPFGRRSELQQHGSTTTTTTTAIGGGNDSSSPLSSNGSSHTLTSPMTIDNQLQQRLGYMNNKVNDATLPTSTLCHQQQQSQAQHMTQQQQQQQNGTQRSALLLIGNNQPMNGIVGNVGVNSISGIGGSGGNVGSGGGGSISSSNSSSSGNALNANSSNAIIGNHINQQTTTALVTAATTAVDKKNANDVCSIVKLMDPMDSTAITGGSSSNCGNNQNKTGNGGFAGGGAAVNFGVVGHEMVFAVDNSVNATTINASMTTKIKPTEKRVSTPPPPSSSSSSLSALAAAGKKRSADRTIAMTTTTSLMSCSNSCDDNRNDNNGGRHIEDVAAVHNAFHSISIFNADSPNKLREENERLSAELSRLRKLLENSPEGAVGGIDLSDSNSCGDAPSTDGSSSTPQQRAERLEAELRSARSQIMSLRIERKKLRSDKGELLVQVKQLCSSLQDKEQQLRDFIRNFQERVRETETNNAKLTGDRERERWQLLKQARDEAERSLALAQQLNARDMQLQRLQDQLQEARRQLSGCLSDQESLLSFAPLTPPSATSGLLNHMTANANASAGDSGRGNSLSAFSGSSGATAGDRNSCSNDSVLRNSSDRESTGGDLNFSDGTCDNGPCITVDPDSISLVSSQNMYQYGTPKERSPTLSPLNSAAYSRSVEQLGSPVDPEGPSGAIARKFPAKTGTLGARNGRGGTWGSISRVFARSRNKSKALSADGTVEYTDYSWSPLSEEGYAEKLRLLREASQLPIERWRASQVLAWLEVALGMPQYSTRCAENVKSGKVLLELNDAELEAGLGLAHPMHRKKLRLAIEEQRRPEMVRYPMITQLGHTWVASEWLPDIGLPQYAESFLHSLVDARMLDTLSKKELEKFLGVTRKFHQASIVHGIHVLRIVKYDRQTLAMRRVQSETVDTDPIVWTNQRFIRWARSIDLAEYADNLKDSGVHGGLVVLEPSFSGDTMATALGIPPSKNIIRRHLTTEFDTLILPARTTLGQGIRSGCGIVPLTGPGGLQHYATADRRSSGSLRSSLSKAFRFNSKSNRSISSIGDRSSFGNSTSPTPSYSSSEGGGGIYATIGAPAHLQQHQHHQQRLPPPTTAPPPPPTVFQYGQSHQQQQHIPGSRVSAPPASNRPALESISDTNLFYEQQQQRRVKSISDIGVSMATNATTTSSGGSGSGSTGGGGEASASSGSPI